MPDSRGNGCGFRLRSPARPPSSKQFVAARRLDGNLDNAILDEHREFGADQQIDFGE